MYLSFLPRQRWSGQWFRGAGGPGVPDLEAAVNRVRDRSSDTHTHTLTLDLRSLLISCAASAQRSPG